jgi:hypothetical protein
MERIRGGSAQTPEQPGGEDAVQEPSPESDPDEGADSAGEPGISPDDQNQLERQLDAPPAD